MPKEFHKKNFKRMMVTPGIVRSTFGVVSPTNQNTHCIQVRDESPNSPLLQGPDLTNLIRGVLCRFRQPLIQGYRIPSRFPAIPLVEKRRHKISSVIQDNCSFVWRWIFSGLRKLWTKANSERLCKRIRERCSRFHTQ